MQAPPAYGQSLLAFARPDTCEFPYAMLTTPVVGIAVECLDGLCVHGGKVRMPEFEEPRHTLARSRRKIKENQGDLLLFYHET